MTPEQWERIARIVEEALSLPPGERKAFVENSCPDPAERAEVSSLVDAHDQAALSGFMKEPLLPSSPVVPAAVFRAIEMRYENVEEIGCGGMSTVFRARDKETEDTVALKVLDPGIYAVAPERFKSELRLARSINHVHVCDVFELYPVEEAGTAFISMEWVDGGSLDKDLPRLSGLRIAKGLEIAGQICDGLTAAHEKDIIHRDLKPGNIMIDREGRARVMDFGIAYSAAQGGSDGGEIVGTPAYMSPEQFEGKDPDPRMDIFAMGLILHEIFSGKRASRDDTDPPRELDPSIPPEIRSVIRRCIQKDPESRYLSAEELKAALPEASSLRVRAGASPMAWLVVAALCVGAGMLIRGVFVPEPAPAPQPDILWEAKSLGPMNHGRNKTVWALDYNSDGSELASAGEDSRIHLWNPATGAKVRTLNGHTGAVTALEFGPEDKFLVSGASDMTVRVWTVSNGQEYRVLRGHTEPVEAVAFDPHGGRVASGGMGNRVILWDVESRQRLPPDMTHQSDVRSVAWSPTGLLASGGYDEAVRLWDPKTRKSKGVIPRQGDWIEVVSFSSDGRYVASGGQNNLARIWDSADGKEYREFEGHTHWIRSLSFDPKMRRLVTASDDGTAKVWDVESEKEIGEIKVGRGLVTAVACSPDGEHFALGFFDGTIEVHPFPVEEE